MMREAGGAGGRKRKEKITAVRKAQTTLLSTVSSQAFHPLPGEHTHTHTLPPYMCEAALPEKSLTYLRFASFKSIKSSNGRLRIGRKRRADEEEEGRPDPFHFHSAQTKEAEANHYSVTKRELRQGWAQQNSLYKESYLTH